MRSPGGNIEKFLRCPRGEAPWRPPKNKNDNAVYMYYFRLDGRFVTVVFFFNVSIDDAPISGSFFFCDVRAKDVLGFT